MNPLSPLNFLALLVLACSAAGAAAQPSCNSDGQPRAAAILERFLSADCASCWTDRRTPAAARGELAVDWIVPGRRGEDAPLSSAASRDAAARLYAIGLPSPAESAVSRLPVAAAPQRLRVAQGPAFNDYIGTSIELKPGRGGPWTAWLLLVETLPAGTEGTPVERRLVRNALRLDWAGGDALAPKDRARRFEARPMRIPEGADPRRLHVLGWVQDAHGRIVAAAQSRCKAR